MSSQCPTCGSLVSCLSQVGKPLLVPRGFTEQVARIRELEAALRKYGMHNDGCDLMNPCSCGFRAALAPKEPTALDREVEPTKEDF
jgi:hypothetical protein